MDSTNLRETVLSLDRRYRYVLWREWAPGPYALFIGLNPSTADEVEDDPTIRRCRNFARDWGFGSLCMANLFAFRTKDPKEMKLELDPVGPANDAWLRSLSADAGITIAAWGAHGNFMNRDQTVMAVLKNPHALGVTAYGLPRHPLYIKADTKPFRVLDIVT